jgi:hypothetical protein
MEVVIIQSYDDANSGDIGYSGVVVKPENMTEDEVFLEWVRNSGDCHEFSRDPDISDEMILTEYMYIWKTVDVWTIEELHLPDEVSG